MGIWEKYKEPIYNKWKEYWYHTHPEDVARYSWDYLFTGGKEIRARLFCELWHYLSPDSEVCAELAFAIECIHVASLILDDSPWMDHAAERRGRKTLHLQFSDKKALLLCHDVMKMVYHIWLENCPPEIQIHDWKSHLQDTLERLTIGQYYDLEKKGNLTTLASLKTGVLFGFVTETVALCIQLNPFFWKEWGNRLGILFQWMDDWHDQEEDTTQGNRNAFNEAYESTVADYSRYWNELCITIGSSWFRTEFGQYLYQYFTNIPFPISTTVPLSSFTQLPVFLPLCTQYHLPSPDQIYKKMTEKEYHTLLPFETSMEMIQTMILMIRRREEFEPLKTNIWPLSEEEWNRVPEIQAWIERVEKETELFKTYNK